MLLLQKRRFERLLQTQKGLRMLNSHENRQKCLFKCLFTALPRAWPSPECSLCRERGWDPIPTENLAGSASSSPPLCYSHQDMAPCLVINFIFHLNPKGHRLHPPAKLKMKCLGGKAPKGRSFKSCVLPFRALDPRREIKTPKVLKPKVGNPRWAAPASWKCLDVSI